MFRLISLCFHLVDVVCIDPRVKKVVQGVQHVDNLVSCRLRREGGETANVAQKYGHALKRLWNWNLALFHLPDNLLGQQIRE